MGLFSVYSNMIKLNRKLENEMSQANDGEKIPVMIGLRPEFLGRLEETADIVVDRYDLDGYDKVLIPTGGKGQIYCNLTPNEIRQMEDKSDKEDFDTKYVRDILKRRVRS